MPSCRFLRPLVLLWATVAAQPLAAQAYDIVIRNGKVLDGMGNPWILADVGIKAGRIARIGRITETGTKEIDATGRFVTPGWIDMMDQSGAPPSTPGSSMPPASPTLAPIAPTRGSSPSTSATTACLPCPRRSGR